MTQLRDPGESITFNGRTWVPATQLAALLDVAEKAEALALSVRGLQNANWDDAGTTRVHRDLVLDKEFALRTALAALNKEETKDD